MFDAAPERVASAASDPGQLNGRIVMGQAPLERLPLERVVVINDYSEVIGGASSIALSTARMLRTKGLQVTYVCGDAGRSADLERAGIPVAALDQKNLRSSGQRAVIRGLFNTAARDLVATVLEADTPGTIYHVHGWSKILSPSIFGALRRVRHRVVMTAHDYFIACPNGAFTNFRTSDECRLIPSSASCVMTNCDKNSYAEKLWRVARDQVKLATLASMKRDWTSLAVHEGMVPRLVRGGVAADRIRVLRNPVTPWTEQRVEAERNDAVVYVGRIDHEKGVDLLARACRAIGAPLHLIGDGPLRDAVQAIYPAAQMAGWVERGRLSDLVKRARVIVVPSRWTETFGLSAFEGIGSGIPVVVSTMASISGEIEARGFGVVFDPNREGELAAILKRLMEDDAEVEAISRRCHRQRDDVITTPTAWIDKVVDIYDDILRRAPLGVAA
ncbi:hypothetical protein N825_21865 [Skermanella stibiiresistens SB22]|uniref:Glycosyl transferase family 1 n=2 Tax=Skermanella TaxID=204447 RepID=W9GWT1_9PROT|nr:hypothetical protein N825_21865 [Skermanella stibiiresistens SB22]